MPWKLRKAPNRDLYWVVTKDTGKKHSKEPLPKEDAEAQMRALYATIGGSKNSGYVKKMVAMDTLDIHKVKRASHHLLALAALKRAKAEPTLNDLKEMLRFVYMDHNPLMSDVGRTLKYATSKKGFYDILDRLVDNSDFTNYIKPFFSERFQIFKKWHLEHPNATPLTEGNPLLIHSDAFSTKRGRRGGGASEEGSTATLQEMAKVSYSPTPPHAINGYTLIHSTPTLKFYKKGNLIIVAIRGTQLNDPRDLAADALAVVGKLRQSVRYRNDLNTLMALKTSAENRGSRFIAVGHSLGGAVLDLFLRQRLVANGLSFNGFPEPQERQGNPHHHRIYNTDDFIYKLFASNIPGSEVRSTQEPLWERILNSSLPTQFYKGISGHSLGNFSGGAYAPIGGAYAPIGGVTIPKKEFIKEHHRLLKVLRSGTKKLRFAEANDQAKELSIIQGR